jgi:hypothetical protein
MEYLPIYGVTHDLCCFEIFGVYQPLAGWFGQNNVERIDRAAPRHRTLAGEQALFSGTAARAPGLRVLAEKMTGKSQAVLSPVGLVNLFREYFFEFDTFLGTPAGHVWISPGGTVEVIESSTRRTLVDKTTQQSEDVTRKSEETLTSQDDVADAVKEDNANGTKLGASASAGANFAGIYHGEASATFSTQNTTHRSSEETHKHTRIQSSKVTSEIHRNFKTTFKTVTETTDTTSRRYVVQNTTDKLVNYELRRKMRKVGAQVQHIGTKLSWQVFLDVPGKFLGLGDLIHVVPAPDLSSLKKPEPPPQLEQKATTFVGAFAVRKPPGADEDVHINMNFASHLPTPLKSSATIRPVTLSQMLTLRRIRRPQITRSLALALRQQSLQAKTSRLCRNTPSLSRLRARSPYLPISSTAAI